MPTIQTIDRAAVQIEQKVSPIPGVQINPTLTPIALAPCFQVVKALDSAGSPKSEAQKGTYTNVDREIKFYDFPDPRTINKHLVHLPAETRVFLQVGAEIREMKEDERWLAGNYTTAATSVRAVGVGVTKSPTIVISGGTPAASFTTPAAAAVLTGSVDISLGANVNGLVLKFRMNKGKWVTVTFSGVDPIAKATIVAQVQAAWVASHQTGTVATSPGNFLVLTSTENGEQSIIEIDDAASTAKTALGFTGANQIAIGTPFPPKPGDELWVDGVLLGNIVTVDAAGQVTLDTEHIVWTGTTPGELNGTRWFVRAKSLTVPEAADRPTPELYKQPAATTASITGTVDLGGAATLNTKTFIFKFDEDSAWTTVTFTSDPNPAIAAVVSAINDKYGKTVASNSADALKMTSTTNGNKSRLYIGSGTANADLGFVNNDFVEGVSVGDLRLEGAFLRDKKTSAILSPGQGTVYIQYRALRKDVTVLGDDPKLVRGSDVTALETQIGPFTTENPLGLAALAMTRAAPDLYISLFGVDSVTSHTEGDRSAYQRALNFLKAQEVYCITAMTNQEEVHDDVHAHCADQSKKENSNFRVCYISPEEPSRKATTVAASGSNANSVGSNTIETEADLAAALLATGLVADPNAPTVSEGVYMVFSGDTKRYNISGSSSVSGMRATSNITFGVGENTDGFYSTSHIPSTYLAKAWTLYVRGKVIALSGGMKDYDTIADAYQLGALNYASRRTRRVVPNDWSMLDGDDQKVRVPGYYASAAAAAQLCYLGASQGKTNYNLPGFDQIWGSNDVFDGTRNLKVIGYNNYLFVQEPVEAGNPITRWHQATTDPTNDDTREESITTELDWGSVVIKRALKQFIGKTSLNDNFDDLFMTAYEGIIRFVVDNSVWAGADLVEFKRKAGSKTGIQLKIKPYLIYPLNLAEIELTL